MKTCKLKRIVVGIMLVILTLGFCVVGTGAARPDMGQPPMGQQGGRGPGFGGQPDFDGETPPELPDGKNMPEDGGCFGGRGGRFNPDEQTPPDGEFSNGDQNGFDGQFGFDGRGGRGRDGGFGPMDRDTRAAIEALEDGETKTELMKLLDDVHTAMEALREADDDSRESAEAAVKEARDALNTALAAAGIEIAAEEPPEKPDGENGTTPPEPPEGGFNMTPPEPPENTTI